MKGSQDEHILELLRDPESLERGFRLLVEQYQESLYRHIWRMVKSHEDTDDALQNTFVKAYRNIGSFQGKSRLYTWLYRIATNESLTLLRSKQLRVARTAEVAAGMQRNEVADAYMDSDEIQLRLANAIKELPDRQHDVFIMRYYDEMSYEEISQKLKLTVGALKASYHHAARKVEASLRKHVQ